MLPFFLFLSGAVREEVSPSPSPSLLSRLESLLVERPTLDAPLPTLLDETAVVLLDE